MRPGGRELRAEVAVMVGWGGGKGRKWVTERLGGFEGRGIRTAAANRLPGAGQGVGVRGCRVGVRGCCVGVGVLRGERTAGGWGGSQEGFVSGFSG